MKEEMAEKIARWTKRSESMTPRAHARVEGRRQIRVYSIGSLHRRYWITEEEMVT